MFRKIQMIISSLTIIVCLVIIGHYELNVINSEKNFDVLRKSIDSEQAITDYPNYTNDVTLHSVSKYITLRDKYENIVGWITDKKGIDYPIMYCKDEYYLHRDIKGNYSYVGCIFTRNNMDDKIVILYGHNMRNGSMFGMLNRYNNKDYWGNLLISDLSLDYDLTVNAYCEIDVNEINLNSETLLEDLKSCVLVGNLSDLLDKKIVILCTCNSKSDTIRNLLVCSY